MPHDEPAPHDNSAHDTAVQEQDATGYEPSYEPLDADEEWLEEPDALPPRARRRLLSPAPLALLGVLLTACGFIGGVLVEKGQTSSSSAGAGAGTGVASRFAALRGGASATGATGARAGAAAGGAGASGGGARPVAGQVAYLSGNTIYLTTAEGNTVKVTTSAGTSVTKSVGTNVAGIHPGETVTVTGSTGAGGGIAAEAIRVGAGGGGLGGLFGGASPRSGGSGGRTGGAAGASGEQALFGKGG
jgi:hypothetical protein